MILKRLDKMYYPSLLLTLSCVAVFCLGKETARMMAVSDQAAWHTVLLFHFAHVNIFHLIGNLMALWPFHPRWSTAAVAYVCSSLSALLLSALIPEYGPMCGLSAFIFACFARRYAMWHKKVWNIILINVIFLVIPQVDAFVHLLSFFSAYLVWKVVATYRERQPL